MIDLGFKTSSNEVACPDILFCLVVKALRPVRIEHCFWGGGHPLSLLIHCTGHMHGKAKSCACVEKKSQPGLIDGSSVAKPFPSNCGSLDLLFADFSMILRILSPIFSQEKRERKTTRRTRENDAGITRPSHFTKKVGHTGTGTTILPDKIVLRSHARPKDDVEARKGKL